MMQIAKNDSAEAGQLVFLCSFNTFNYWHCSESQHFTLSRDDGWIFSLRGTKKNNWRKNSGSSLAKCVFFFLGGLKF